MNRDELEVVLKDHSKWLKDSTKGRKADLSSADLSSADLSYAKQKIILITGSRHSIYAIDGDIRIGCQRQSLEDWLKNYKDVGEKEGYTSEQIREYGLYLKAIAEILENKGK